MKKKRLIVAGVILAILIGMIFAVTNGLSEGTKVPINGIDLSNVPDGIYTGTHEFKRWTNTVAVHIEDHRITAVDIEKGMADPQNCSAELFRRVIAAQNTMVDAVSGATVTSKAYLKAIENAFAK